LKVPQQEHQLEQKKAEIFWNGGATQRINNQQHLHNILKEHQSMIDKC